MPLQYVSAKLVDLALPNDLHRLGSFESKVEATDPREKRRNSQLNLPTSTVATALPREADETVELQT